MWIDGLFNPGVEAVKAAVGGILAEAVLVVCVAAKGVVEVDMETKGEVNPKSHHSARRIQC